MEPKLLEQHVPGITAALLRLVETRHVAYMEFVEDKSGSSLTCDGWCKWRPKAFTLTIRFTEGEEQTCHNT